MLVLTVDGKGVVMRPEDLREPTQRAAAARARTFTARLGIGRRLHAKRMAAVAAILYRRALCAHARRDPAVLPRCGKRGPRGHGLNTNGSGQPGAVAGG